MKYFLQIIMAAMLAISFSSAQASICPPGFEINFGAFFTGDEYCEAVSELDMETLDLYVGNVFADGFGFYDFEMHWDEGVFVITEVTKVGDTPEETEPQEPEPDPEP